MLKSTYGVGRDAVITALRGINKDIDDYERTLQSLRSELNNKRLTHAGSKEMLLGLRAQVPLEEKLRESALETALFHLTELGRRKEAAFKAHSEAISAATIAEGELHKFSSGHALWVQLAKRHHSKDFEWLLGWLEQLAKRLDGKIFGLEQGISKLHEEDDRLSSKRSSWQSEQLAAQLGGETLESALINLSSEEAISSELVLGGMKDGLVGVELSVLEACTPAEGLPEIFWIGKGVPATRPTRKVGRWFICDVAGGQMVTRDDRIPSFGAQGRVDRRAAIKAETEKLTLRLKKLLEARSSVKERYDSVLANKEKLKFYLLRRSEQATIIEAERTAREREQKAKIAYEEAGLELIKQNDITKNIGRPYDEKINTLRTDIVSRERDLAQLDAEISFKSNELQNVEAAFNGFQQERNSAAELLGPTNCFDLSKPVGDEHPARVLGVQAQRLTALAEALGEQTASRMKSLEAANPADRVSVLGIWPDLMKIVREIVSTDIADTDGEDLIESMKERRAGLESTLINQESEVRVKSRSLNMHINTAIRTQRVKIDNLSELGNNIEFGNVIGVRIRMAVRDRMVEILDKITDQLSLFASSAPIEVSLRSFFEDTSNGDISMEGEELLDYRNYVDLIIDARRKDGQWKPASSLSNTEAIGSGLALALMLTRSMAMHSEAAGDGVKATQVHPIFAVDEVSRLNKAGLGALTEFARKQAFQLLVTAPALEPASDCILYVLARVFDPAERVIIRGARVSLPVVGAYE